MSRLASLGLLYLVSSKNFDTTYGVLQKCNSALRAVMWRPAGAGSGLASLG